MPRLNPILAKQRHDSIPPQDVPLVISRSGTHTSLFLEEPEKYKPKPDPLELVYNIRYNTFRFAPRSTGTSPLILLILSTPLLLFSQKEHLH
jgi:hypothetical protein